MKDGCAAEYFLWRTSGGVFVGGVVSEALDEALDGEGLTDSFESLSASLAPLLFTWEHKYSSASLRYIYWQTIKYIDNIMNIYPLKLSEKGDTVRKVWLETILFLPTMV